MVNDPLKLTSNLELEQCKYRFIFVFLNLLQSCTRSSACRLLQRSGSWIQSERTMSSLSMSTPFIHRCLHRPRLKDVKGTSVGLVSTMSREPVVSNFLIMKAA